MARDGIISLRLSTALLLLSLLLSISINFYLVDRFILSTPEPSAHAQLYTQPAATPSPQDSLHRQFLQLDFTAASQGLARLQQQNPEATSQLSQRWQLQTQRWQAERKLSLVNKLLRHFLNQFPDDLPWLLIRAEQLILTGNINSALEEYYQLLKRISDDEQERKLLERIHQRVAARLDILKAQQQWLKIIELVEPLLAYEPVYPPYLLALTQANLQRQDYDNAQQLLGQVPLTGEYRPLVHQLQVQIDLALSEDSNIDLHPMGEHYLIAGTINDDHDIRLIIDTGASTSVLSRAKFNEIRDWADPEFISEENVYTAGGVVNAPVYRFTSFRVNNLQVEDLIFVIIDLPDRRSDGLLGMNFLKQFHFQIDQQNDQLRISPRRNFTLP